MTVNGLGAWWFPKFIRDWLTEKSKSFFKEAAWEKHDIGYARAYPDRRTCDLKFLQAMLRDASEQDTAIKATALALLFWACVRIGGRWSYGHVNIGEK